MKLSIFEVQTISNLKKEVLKGEDLNKRNRTTELEAIKGITLDIENIKLNKSMVN